MIRQAIKSALVMAIVGIAINKLLRRLRRARGRRHEDQLLDQSLVETFPASDPSASQDFSNPQDRR